MGYVCIGGSYGPGFALNQTEPLSHGFNGLLVPKKFNGVVWIFIKRFGFSSVWSKTWVYRFIGFWLIFFFTPKSLLI